MRNKCGEKERKIQINMYVERERERERGRERDSRIILVTSNMNFYIDERIRRETL